MKRGTSELDQGIGYPGLECATCDLPRVIGDLEISIAHVLLGVIMSPAIRRRLTLKDTTVLIAATAVGIAWARGGWDWMYIAQRFPIIRLSHGLAAVQPSRACSSPGGATGSGDVDGGFARPPPDPAASARAPPGAPAGRGNHHHGHPRASHRNC